MLLPSSKEIEGFITRFQSTTNNNLLQAAQEVTKQEDLSSYSFSKEILHDKELQVRTTCISSNFTADSQHAGTMMVLLSYIYRIIH